MLAPEAILLGGQSAQSVVQGILQKGSLADSVLMALRAAISRASREIFWF